MNAGVVAQSRVLTRSGSTSSPHLSVCHSDKPMPTHGNIPGSIMKSTGDGTCGGCANVVTDEERAMFCEICELWYHIKCEKMSVPMYNMLKEEENAAVHWYCKRCNTGFAKVLSSVSKVEKMCERLNERVGVIETKLESGVDMASIEEMIVKKLDERDERRRREPNLILFNLEEPRVESDKDMQESDVKFIGDICASTLKVPTPQVSKSRRIGKKGDKPRPLCVTIPDRDERYSILQNSRLLRNSEFDNISISRDYTNEQRATNKKLRIELQRVRASDPDDNYVIRRGEVIKLPYPKGSGGDLAFRG
jgi:hypothetical protein